MTLDTTRPTDADPVGANERLDSSDRKMFKALKQHLTLCCCVNIGADYEIAERDYMR